MAVVAPGLLEKTWYDTFFEGWFRMKQFEAFALDTANECLWREGVQLSLRPKPFAVLRYLVEHAGRLITHDELLEVLWPETYVQPQVLRTYMLELRKALGDEAGQPRFIQTLPKRGYCFVAPVTECADGRRSASANSMQKEEARAIAIVGREEELTLLETRMQQSATGQRRTVFITGEAGIGKTALVDAFSQHSAFAPQACIARGQCVEGVGRTEEYYPVVEALGQLCSGPEGDRVCRILTRMAPAWLTGAACDQEAKRTTVDRTLGDLCAALEELAADKPLIFVFEDLHWADESTLHLISALARRRAPARLMLLGTFRAHEASEAVAEKKALLGLKQDLLMRRLGEEIALAPLGKSAVKELLRRELHQEELPTGLATFVHQHSEGNPLFVIAIVEHLIAQCFLMRETSDELTAWQQRAPFAEIEASVPDGLAQMIEREVERLSPMDQRLLEAASLTDVASPAWAIAAALEMDQAEAEEACDNLARRLYFVQRVGQDELPDGSRSAFYVFAHGLYREVLYQRQAVARRARRHVRVAERLGQLFTGREADVAREIAQHLEAACQWSRAADALRTAARQALQRQAYAEAAHLLEHAYALTENMGRVEGPSAQAEIQAELDAARQAASSIQENVKPLQRKLDDF